MCFGVDTMGCTQTLTRKTAYGNRLFESESCGSHVQIQPSASTPKEQEAQPVPPEVDPMNHKEGEGRSVSPTVSWTNPPHSGPFSTKENKPSSSSWKQTYDNVRGVKKRAQEKNICLCCASDANSLIGCDNENFKKEKQNILECFDHIEKILKVNFTQHDEVITKRDQAEREKRREQRLLEMMTRMSRWRTLTCPKKPHNWVRSR